MHEIRQMIAIELGKSGVAKRGNEPQATIRRWSEQPGFPGGRVFGFL